MKRFFCVCLFFLALVGVLSVSAAQNVVSLHKGYTLSPGASQGYPDENFELTNGKYGTPVENGTVNYYYRDTEYVGFRNEGEITVVLDLGEVYTQLWTFEVSYLREEEVGITAPAKVAFYLSSEEEGEFTPLGEVIPSPGTEKAGIASLEGTEGTEGRYLKVVITPGEGAWTFLDEVSVLQGKNPLSAPGESSTPEQSRTSQPSQSPMTGDRDLVSFVLLCGVSAVGTAALIGRKRFA